MEKKCIACGHKVAWLSAGNNVVLAFVKGFIGIISGSRALLADALHSGSDIVCALFAAWATRFGEKPIDKKHPYGYGKIEFIVGMFVGLVLVFAAAEILRGSIKVLFLRTKISPPQMLALWAALLSVYSNFVVSHYTLCAAKTLESPALKAISTDNRSDAISSIPVVLCVIGSQLGFPQLDPFGAVLIGLIVARMGIGLMIENYHGLLDVSVSSEKLDKIKETVVSCPGVRKISYLKTRKLGQKIWVDVQVNIEGDRTVKEANVISQEIRSALMRRIQFISNVQVSVKPS